MRSLRTCLTVVALLLGLASARADVLWQSNLTGTVTDAPSDPAINSLGVSPGNPAGLVLQFLYPPEPLAAFHRH